MKLNAHGNALLGAMTAVMISGFVGASMVAYYESFVRQSRMAYVRAIMTSVDNKIRFMAQQPYAYICGEQKTGAVANQLDGVLSCVINEAYFAGVTKTIIPGTACPGSSNATVGCGLTLNFRPAVAGHPPLDFKMVTNPNTGVVEQAALFPYELVYDGTDFSLRSGGYDLKNEPVTGMLVPREVLQSEVFDCSAVDPTKPVFGGFDDTTGRPICRGFNECATGSYGTELNFKTLVMTCKPLATPDKNVNCNTGQNKISNVSFSGGVVNASCTELPVPPVVPGATGNTGPTGPPPTAGTAGACGPSSGATLTAAPTTGLCAVGAPSAVAGSGPWTWTCAGQDGGPDAPCSALTSSSQGVWFAQNYSGFAPGAPGCLAFGAGVVYAAPTGPCDTIGQQCNYNNFNAIAGSAEAHATCLDKAQAKASCLASATNGVQITACNVLFP